MIERSFLKGDAQSSALYSDCERYRYSLTRVWDSGAQRLNYIMLNPSKATEVQNDPTIERCERRARQLGFGAMTITNIFAWRETHPEALRKARHPVGDENDVVLCQQARWSNVIIAAWGVHGTHLQRGDAVEKLLKASDLVLHHLGLTKDGHPRHPLYVSYRTELQVWRDKT
jgi:hypothetical protein